MKLLRVSPVVRKSVESIFIRSVATQTAPDTNTGIEQPLKSWREIPGPSSLPLLGPMLHFIKNGNLHNLTGYQFGEYMYKNFGNIVRLDGAFGMPPMVMLFDPESMAQVLRNENWMPERPGFMSLEYFRKEYNKHKNDAPTGLLTEHGENWKFFRSTVNPVMLQPKTIRLYNTALDEVAQDMVVRMKSIRDEKNMIKESLDVEMNKWALESIAVVALGGRIGCLKSDLPEDSHARRLIKCVHDTFQVADELDFKPSLWRYYSTANFKKAMKIYQDQIDLSKYFIQSAVKEINAKKESGATEEKGVLEKLLEVDENIAVIMATDMLLAGVDTAANTMIATLYLLGTNPEKQNKLRQEILSKDERKPYLKACIKESMRMLPVVAGNMRRTTKEYNILGYLIPKGMMVVTCHEYVSRQESQYERASEYIPERWLNKSEEAQKSKAHPLATSPFGFGARSCIGRRIAELEIETFLARVIESFDVEWVGPPLKQQTRSVTYMLGPYDFIFKDVKN